MRHRKGASAPADTSTAATHTAYPVSLGGSQPAYDAGSMDAYDFRYGAATTDTVAANAFGTFRSRSSRLEAKESSLSYTSQVLLLQVMDRIPFEVSHYFVPSPSRLHEAVLSRIREQYGRPYSGENELDVELLGRLWNGHNRVMFAPKDLAFSPEAHSVSDRWKEMGFQGTDPSTDFRGAGVLGLVNLVYLVEHYPQQWSAILTPDFLAAAAGLNVTLRLSTLLGINSSVNQFSASILSSYSARAARLRLCRFIYDSSVDVAIQRLCEVYCFAMRLLHYRWILSSRNIMEFNQLLTTVYEELDRLLFMSKTLEGLCTLL
ncbi:hypothetical protein CUR178_06519 [Leishmania enriettii]|uniref:ELMO domain-containing protein n=1 Tax=Leishmania enriettii TaxID=5663 RepID=A0A836GY63_LEIEN|nr:hypothetical protein CUR178_06519 [Leishmania enriettii]